MNLSEKWTKCRRGYGIAVIRHDVQEGLENSKNTHSGIDIAYSKQPSLENGFENL